MLAVDIGESDGDLQELQGRAIGVVSTTCGERVYKLMLESLPKQIPDNPELSVVLTRCVPAGQSSSRMKPHTMNSDPGSDFFGLGDVTMDQDDIGNVTNEEMGGMVDVHDGSRPTVGKPIGETLFPNKNEMDTSSFLSA